MNKRGFWNPRKTKTSFRIVEFFVSGTCSTLVDLLILALLTEIFSIYYLFSSAISFVISSTLSYSINKNWGFKDGKRRVYIGYPLFILFTFIGLLLTVFLMWIFVSKIGIYYLFARIIVALIVGTMNFIFHSFFTFKTIKSFRDLY